MNLHVILEYHKIISSALNNIEACYRNMPIFKLTNLKTKFESFGQKFYIIYKQCR